MKKTVSVLAVVGVACGLASADEFFLTQNVVPDVVIGGNVACSADAGLSSLDTGWWRSYDLSGVNGGDDVTVMNVQFGVEASYDFYGGDVTMPAVDVNLYTDPTGGTIIVAELDLLGSVASVDVPFGSFFLQDVAMDVDVPGGTDLVMEVYQPDDEPNDLGFWLGSNNFGETGASYLSSAACGIIDPVTYPAIGFPGIHIIINATACPSDGGGCYADCNGDGTVNIFDFLCFQGLVTKGDPAADCNGDGPVNIFDFLCFQGEVTNGC
jgi:hypothetical protein